ncbi:MAG: DUF2314 domain-containing protein [Mesorhizobium sp.]|uniref:DUF2314 domain-containing protein n=2 Tax=Mesorhizobium TaxID=68287 RepID=UPI000F74C246|nr:MULTISPECIES: DUF2314 domain-containing protein [unclassified Mesorhizobium]AZO47331.1 DUF2314 domain-containing protein [Mesorhizobium sp. M4B.F.Ca.ET.058.02.1.1]RVC41908.1 DUF2314 domain-containing protein [Mesorhizobium sp. M4A.F.Ca.ET.090.04.2.1]RWC55754.1 MAG: DUF2314 domain-containing protein [Mesorhizobium sp.]RWD06518.1 MAG: DUF2314 domain-containing protein [Mesorhizobium sp.]RWD14072.1 MAG: DUF2314 domain-containing protein [Mesorhizobium sp.]
MRNPVLAIVFVAAVGYGLFNALGHGRSDKPMAIPAAAPGASQTAPRAMTENVVAYSTEDKAMQAAKNKGHSTLPRFHELMAAGTPGTYTVKFPLTQNGATEHIWMQLTGLGDGTFIGLLADEPVNGTKYKMGDRMTVEEADVEDWMVKNGGEVYGGYTVRQAFADMPKEQAAKYGITFKD